MSSLALLFVGAVLLINGLVFLERVDGKAAIPINLFTGSVLVLNALLLVASVGDNEPEYSSVAFAASGFALFGFTYLTVATNSLVGGTGRALGWYCGWASIISLSLSMINFSSNSDPAMGWLWLSWSTLFVSFFAALVLKNPWFVTSAGVLAILQSFSTATIPALLMIDGSWGSLSLFVIGAVQIGVAVAYVLLILVTRKKSVVPQENPTAIPAVIN